MRDYATKNFNSVLQRAEEEMERDGWVKDYDPTRVPRVWDSPSITVRGLVFRRPWGDFLWALVRYAMDNYYVTEATAKSYAKEALRPLENELLGRKYVRSDEVSKYK